MTLEQMKAKAQEICIKHTLSLGAEKAIRIAIYNAYHKGFKYGFDMGQLDPKGKSSDYK